MKGGYSYRLVHMMTTEATAAEIAIATVMIICSF
jgi:hypothetical protein